MAKLDLVVFLSVPKAIDCGKGTPRDLDEDSVELKCRQGIMRSCAIVKCAAELIHLYGQTKTSVQNSAQVHQKTDVARFWP